MATLDQLPAEQRAIVELVVQRGRSYDALADVLQVPSERVRELARDALSELSPRTASRVDPDRRGQIADYLLGQQSADDARATRDYLKLSEPARAWALSLLDSLDPLYANGSQPSVPEPDGAAVAEPVAAKPKPEQPLAAKPDPEAAKPAAETAEDRVRTRERERTRKRAVAAAVPEEPEATERERKPARAGTGLSPEAQSALRRRRLVGAVAALAVIVVAVLVVTGAFSSDSKKKSTTAASSTTTPGASTTAAQQPVQVLGQIPLNPIGGVKAAGVAYIVQQGSQRYVVVQAQVPPLPSNQKVAAYEVWLYNSNADARSLGAQYTNTQGVLQGRAPLPADVGKFKAIDVSRELFSDQNAGHSNNSVLRGTFATLKPVPQQPQQGGTTTTPGP